MQPTLEARRFLGDGVSLAADVSGPLKGQPILFLHGGGQTRHSWGNAVIEAARRGFHAVTLDLRGHGESDWAPDGVYAMETFCADVRLVMASLERAPVIVGASMGGLVGLVVAAAPPPPVAALILVDVSIRLEPEGTREIGAFMTSAPDGFASLDEAADAVSAYLPHRPRPKDTSGLLRNLRLHEDGRYRWHWDPAFIRPASGNKAPDPALLESAAANLSAPTLLVRGGKSRVVSRQGVDEFLALAPHAQYVDVAGADHMVAGDANDSFNAAIFDFIEQLDLV
ncbi:alpha/beta hydrolase [Sphingomonas sp. BIUV-7]|uniref:Alpha/beta hydrolase n=1 Tax=Sphingomonas natans TaxID=3063330 RepID=A0ABT8Y8C4_9SPHN|nr:alpha/beta hydrolase [Sphingomonas sp. BIUV-7]MDO6414572.1 alpha/beta hydrolase [Sphingomonas sp. BIUV-7]